MRLRNTTRACVELPRDCRSSFRRVSSFKTIGCATRVSRSPHPKMSLNI
jgi:hypothetical protein